MARPRPIADLRPELPAIAAARLILEVRLGELLDLAPAVEHPAQSQGHHDLRIAAKRLRYSLETFGELFATDLSPLARELRAIQDHLGRIHDYDVFVPWFERYRAYRRLEAETKLRMTTIARPGRRTRGWTIADYRAALATTAEPEEDEAILRLIERTRARREAAFAQFQGYWQDLMAGGFAARLRRAIA
jgi:CHAD domain-containing protein